ncbi:MAG: hypothetical protein JO171_02885 [Paludibacterium sp.]|uniref:hypothetical protein n=1 Tax=Paludibacterium sp. TaxID=1917523 RepID=UPI0025FA33BF|nr:hypothetical protein [Paludibacterium sp.]MBV8046070.1 hypothetical protein [Paludibacterium sp.]MBV8646159.1 hypothetical protein [Paludibacterium sp.]
MTGPSSRMPHFSKQPSTTTSRPSRSTLAPIMPGFSIRTPSFNQRPESDAPQQQPKKD